ncbi:MAG: IPT/TIG domain-containing protein [Planctomycetes bacterium]|nr:IPT/TIG domain-containing protein [Planctomycetota bacterium]
MRASDFAWLQGALVRLAVSSVAAIGFAQAPVSSDPPRTRLAPPAVCQAFDAQAGTLQLLAVPTSAAAGALVVELGGSERTLLLQPHELRSPAFALLEIDAAGARSLPRPPLLTFRGQVVGLPDARVALTLVPHGIAGVVRLGDGSSHLIQPMRDVDPNAPPGLHFVHRSADARALPWRCGVAMRPTPPLPPAGAAEALFTCEIACTADFPFYQQNGSSTAATQADIMAVINAMDLIYRADCDIAYTVTSILVHTVADPYTTTEPSGLLTQFQIDWNQNRTGVARDVAHLFTGRSMWSHGGVIGIAYISTVCFLTGAYGVSQSRFTTNLGQRVGLTAHELGHNWSANHCDGAGDCRIMCSGLGGCSGNLGSFSGGEQAAIESYRNIAACLDLQASPPTVASLSPASVPAWHPPEVTISGQGLLGTSQVLVGTQVLGPGQFTLIDDATVRFMPPALAVGPHAVAVVNPAGTSSPRTLTITGSSPPQLDAPAGAIGGLLLQWRFAGQPADPWFLLVSFSPATTPVLGWPLLQSFGIVGSGVFAASGLGSFGVALPVGILHGAMLHGQLAEIDATPGLAGTSAVMPTRVFF